VEENKNAIAAKGDDRTDQSETETGDSDDNGKNEGGLVHLHVGIVYHGGEPGEEKTRKAAHEGPTQGELALWKKKQARKR